MVACDGEGCPREWFHLECVGLTVAPEDNGEFSFFFFLPCLSPYRSPFSLQPSLCRSVFFWGSGVGLMFCPLPIQPKQTQHRGRVERIGTGGLEFVRVCLLGLRWVGKRGVKGGGHNTHAGPLPPFRRPLPGTFFHFSLFSATLLQNQRRLLTCVSLSSEMVLRGLQKEAEDHGAEVRLG
jgi:hypothetical protein